MALQTYTSAPDTPITYAENSTISFEINGENNPCSSVSHYPGTAQIIIRNPGLYMVSYNGFATGSGNVAVQLYTNGTAVPYAKCIATSTGLTDAVPLNFNTYIRVLPSCAAINNTTTMTINNVGVEANYYLNNLLVSRVSN